MGRLVSVGDLFLLAGTRPGPQRELLGGTGLKQGLKEQAAFSLHPYLAVSRAGQRVEW